VAIGQNSPRHVSGDVVKHMKDLDHSTTLSETNRTSTKDKTRTKKFCFRYFTKTVLPWRRKDATRSPYLTIAPTKRSLSRELSVHMLADNPPGGILAKTAGFRHSFIPVCVL